MELAGMWSVFGRAGQRAIDREPAYAERYTDTASKVIAKANVIVALDGTGRQLMQVVTNSIK